MPIKKISFFLFFLLTHFFGFTQNKGAISGVVVNRDNNEALPFASITLKNYPIGTISNEEGEFDFYVPKSKRNDTILVSFIGFNNYEIPVANITDKLQIRLQPSNEVLREVIVSRLSPLDYIKKALDHLDENYPQNPYQTIAYYRENFHENQNTIGKREAVFKTYYVAKKDSAKNQHQLLLYRETDNKEDFQFMRDWIDKKIEKEKKKAKKKAKKSGELPKEGSDEDFDFAQDMNMGGPQMIIEMADISGSNKSNFLTPKYFDKYTYTFGEEQFYNDELLVTINYKAKKKIDYVRDQGTVLISKNNYAIAFIKGTGVLSIPLFVKPILFAIGLSIKNPQFNYMVRYQKYKDKWYPKLFRWDANITLKKRHMFKANEHANLKIGQVFFINKLDSLATPIPPDKRFDTNEKMGTQVFNDLGLSWEGMNVIKD